MQIIPVLDLLGGIVVRGVAGERERYRPVESVLTGSSDPLAVAEALRAAYGFAEFYVADLDGILDRGPDLGVLRRLRESGFRCLVDAGVRSGADARSLFEAGADSVIVCLETNPQEALLKPLLGEFGAERLIFSLDLKAGRPLGALDEGGRSVVLQIAHRVWEFGFRRMIVLDLAAVGVDAGPATLDLCRQFRREFAGLQIITGGGVRDRSDLAALADAGADAALIASALHSGKLPPKDLRAYG